MMKRTNKRKLRNIALIISMASIVGSFGLGVSAAAYAADAVTGSRSDGGAVATQEANGGGEDQTADTANLEPLVDRQLAQLQSAIQPVLGKNQATPSSPLTSANDSKASIPIAPYYRNADGNMSVLAQHIRILTYGGVAGKAQDAGFSGDWTTPLGRPGQLRVWQAQDKQQAKLKVCVVDAASENHDDDYGCLHQGDDNGGYEVATSLGANDQWPADAVHLSATVDSISVAKHGSFIYVKLGDALQEIVGEGNDAHPVTFDKGSIVKIPVSQDEGKPIVGISDVVEPDEAGKRIDFNDDNQVSLDRSKHTLRVDERGVRVKVKVTDWKPKPTSSTASVSQQQIDATVSGPQAFQVMYKGDVLDPAAVRCSAENGRNSPSDDTLHCEFNIDQSLLIRTKQIGRVGTIGTVKLSDFALRAFDQAGNAGDVATLDKMPPFAADANDSGSSVQQMEFVAFPSTDIYHDSFGIKIKDMSSNVLCGASDEDSCEGKTLKAKQVTVVPNLSHELSNALKNDLSVFGPKVTYNPSSEDANSNIARCIGKHPCDVNARTGKTENDENTVLGEGRYSVTYTLSYTTVPTMLSSSTNAVNGGSNTVEAKINSVLIDGTAPTAVAAVTLSDSSADTWLQNNSFVDKSGTVPVTVAATNPERHIGIKVDAEDLLRRVSDTRSHARENAVKRELSEGQVSGVSSFSFSYVRYDDYADALAVAQGKHPSHEGVTTTLNTDELSGFSASVELDADGAYPISSMVASMCDYAGNCTTDTTMTDADAVLASDGSPFNPGFDVVVVNDTRSVTSNITLVDNQGAPESSNPFYHRGAVSARLTIHDKWFDVTRHLPGRSDGPLRYSLCGAHEQQQQWKCGNGDGEASRGNEFPGVKLPDFKQDSGNSNEWSTSVPMPQSQIDGQHRSLEGEYRLWFDYVPIGHDSTTALSKDSHFCVDYTAPDFSEVHYSDVDIAQWGWIFAQGDEHITVQTADAVSGIDDGTVQFSGQWQKVDAQHPAITTSSNGNVNIAFGNDSQRLVLAGSVVSIKDKAGNQAHIDLGNAKSANLPKKVSGIVIDKAAPVISVSYDNNDVRNGKYYKAQRHGTVTVVESNFDFIKTNDEWRDVVMYAVDGSKGRVTAGKFKNDNGDGKTWVADLPCEQDGDWSIDVSLTDPAKHRAHPYHEEFTIDTQKPILSLSFDNDDAESGNYYKATRKATIRQTERNFSADETIISTTAKDDKGRAVTPPAASGWSAADEDYERQATVNFDKELHYTLRVEATDLAGNVAEVVEEPEFIVDMTKPQVVISGVNDKTAYSGTLLPKIEFSDANFDSMLTDYTLTRTHIPGKSRSESAKRGKAKDNFAYVKDSESEGETSTTVSFEDIGHTVDNDDVYTLTATIKDKAGNESEQKVVYSLNRFGSNYILDKSAQDVLGKYIKSPRAIRVTEINVSGIDIAKSHMELVHDQQVSSINDGADYHMTKQDSSGWQMAVYDFPASLFSDDGYYRLRMTSVDEAGNLSQNTMNKKNERRNGDAQVNFAVDGHAPSSKIADLGDKSVFYEPTHNFVVDAHDDVALRSVTMNVDGHNVAQWSGDDVLAPMSYKLNADEKAHSITLTSVDMAGNTTVSAYRNVIVASSWWSYAMVKGLLLPGIVITILAIALAALGVVLLIRYRRTTAYQKNVFGR